MNDVIYILPLMVIIYRRTSHYGPLFLDILACFAPAVLVYAVPKCVLLFLWHRGHLTWPVQSDPVAHWVCGTISFIICLISFEWLPRRRARKLSEDSKHES